MLDVNDRKILEKIVDSSETPLGAFNIRKNGQDIERNTTSNINILTKKDNRGLDIIVKSGAKGESVQVAAIISEGLDDSIRNTFEIGENADVLIVSGCGIHNLESRQSQHDRIHQFLIRKGARMRYVEKNYGEEDDKGQRILHLKTIIEVEENGAVDLEIIQVTGIDQISREIIVRLQRNASLILSDRLLTYFKQMAETKITVILAGDGATTQVISRSVAENNSKQLFHLNMCGYAKCRGNIQCDSIIMDEAEISYIPEISAFSSDAQLTQETAIGKIGSEQLIKLMSLGMMAKEAEQKILQGFLK